jgi:hypothetical protein
MSKSVELMTQWILIFLQVIFAKSLMARLEATEFQDFKQKKKNLRYIKLYMIIASVLEAILSSIYISLMYFMANEFKDKNEYNNITI